MKARYVAILSALLLAGCGKEGTVAKDSPTYQGEATKFVFNGEIDGCKLYYVRPVHGASFHLAVCETHAQASWRESCGKSCSRDMAVTTAVRR